MQESNLPPEETSHEEKQVIPISFKKKRAWTEEEKRAIVEECRQHGATVSGVARKNGVPANLVFQWRKLFEEAPLDKKLSISEQMELDVKSSLSFIRECERIEQLIAGNLLADSRAKKISPYNASIALSNLVTSREKLINLSLNLLERLQKLRPIVEEPEPEADETDLRFKRQVEILCMEMADQLYPPQESAE